MQLYSIHESFDKNKDFKKIRDSVKIVKVSKFTYDCLNHFIRSKNQMVLKQFLEKEKIRILITQENDHINRLIMTEVEANKLRDLEKIQLKTGFTK